MLGGDLEVPPDTDPENIDELIHHMCTVDMCEVFSPPRVSVEAEKFGMQVGDAMDLTTGWDFNKAVDRQ